MADGRVVIQAILDTVNVTKNVKGLKDSLNGVSWKNIAEGDKKAQELSSSFKSAGTACTIGLTTPIVAAGTAAFSVASQYESATSRIQAAFGVTREEAQHFKDIGAGIYEGGWGDSLDEVNDALIQCKSTLRDVSDEDLSTITTNALMLSNTFGADVNESIRGVNALMEGFGLTADEATDLMTAGMQRGLNYTDELGDNLSEYSVRWGEAGMSASQYFSLLEAGASNGAYNLDKVGDFLNEFLTSLTDGRMEEGMGSFSQGTQDVFNSFKNGGASAQDVLNAVVGELSTMPDQYEAAQIASDTWSSLGEDNAFGMIASLANVQDSYGDVAGAAQGAADAASDSFANKAESAVRTLKGSLESFGEPLLNIATMVADVASAFGNWLSSLPAPAQQAIFIILGIVAAIGPVLGVIGNIISIIPTLATAINTVKTAFSILNATMAANPIGLIISLITLLVGAFVYFWTTSEEFRSFWIGLWDSVCAAVSGIAEWFNANVITPIVNFFTELGTSIQAIWDGITAWISEAINTMGSIISAGVQVISDVWNAIWGAISGFFSGIWNGIVSGVTTYINYVQTVISTVLSVISSIWSGIWSGISSFISSVWNGIKGIVSGAVNAVSNTISSVFNAVKSTVSSIWNGIKSAIETPMNAARDIVRNIIDAIKGFFNFSISWPHIPLPHFSISPAGWQVGDLLEGKIPSLGIDWYATGGVFNGPSVIGVGEAGKEAAIPLEGRHMKPFAKAISSYMKGDAEVASEIHALRKELPKLFAFYCAKSLEVNKREFARLVNESKGWL